MKKILALCIALFIVVSCSLDPDPQPSYYYEFLPTKAVYIPSSVIPGKNYKIRVKYLKPTGCHLFDRFYTEKDGEAILIAVQAIVREDSQCSKAATDILEDATFTFKCPANYSGHGYTFKFYVGTNQDGTKEYEEVVIPVK